MSLSSALNTSVGGLRAQAASISAVSENIANSRTVAYKTRNVDFRALVVGSNTRSANVTGGVLYGKSQNVGAQGLIEGFSHRNAVFVGHNHPGEDREAVLLGLQVERLHVQQRLLDGNHQQISLDRPGALAIPQRDLLGNHRILVDPSLDLLWEIQKTGDIFFP